MISGRIINSPNYIIEEKKQMKKKIGIGIAIYGTKKQVNKLTGSIGLLR